MATVLDLIENISKLDVKRLATDAIERTIDVMPQLNREQLEYGLDSRETKIKPSYQSRSYATKKNQMNPAPGMWHPDLILTGAFTASIKVNLSGDKINFKATDLKAPDLLEKYGDDILGLGDTQQEYYNDSIFFPEFSNDITLVTGLEFK